MDCPIPNATGTLRPEGSGSAGVMLLGEAMGEQEAMEGLPFRPWAPAGSILERAIRRVGAQREQFVVWNVVPTQPPKNWLEGAPWEQEAVAWGKGKLDEMVRRYHPRCIVSLGSTATRVVTGLTGPRFGMRDLSGFIMPSVYEGVSVIPCFHPAYLRRGAMGHFGVLLRAIRLAMQVAREGRQPQLPPVDNPPGGYVLYPTEEKADEFVEEALGAKALAYDIETNHSTAEDEAEESGDGNIRSVQFSHGIGQGIFFPWREPFIDRARRLLRSGVPKLGWNNWRFDDPLLRANGVQVAGENHDLMWAWHHTQPDLPRGLQFAAAQRGWPWPWKHLDHQHPQYYGIVDVDVLHFMA